MLLDGNAARHVLPTSLSWTSLSNAHNFLRVLLLAFPVTSTCRLAIPGSKSIVPYNSLISVCCRTHYHTYKICYVSPHPASAAVRPSHEPPIGRWCKWGIELVQGKRYVILPPQHWPDAGGGRSPPALLPPPSSPALLSSRTFAGGKSSQSA